MTAEVMVQAGGKSGSTSGDLRSLVVGTWLTLLSTH